MATKQAKPLTRAQIERKVAQLVLWVVMDRRDGKLLSAHSSRRNARRFADMFATPNGVIVRAEMRVKGQRA